MSVDTNFFALFHRNDEDYELPPPAPEGPNFCPYAKQFAQWVEPLCEEALRNPTHVTINQAKVRALDKFREWRTFVPKKHRAYTGNQHLCIFHVFQAAYERLRTAELSLSPPMLFIPPPPLPPPPPPPAPQIAGIFLAEMEEE